MRIEKGFKSFIRLLNKNQVKYVIVGAFALAFYDVSRSTKDMDIFVEASGENLERILDTLDDFGFGRIDIKKKDFQDTSRIIQVGSPPMRIDIITSIPGVEFAPAWKNKLEGKYDDSPCFFISKEDLIKNKQAADRLQDKEDLEKLETIKGD